MEDATGPVDLPVTFNNFDWPFVLGARNVRGTIGGFAPVQLDEVAFYHATLSAARILAHYDASGLT